MTVRNHYERFTGSAAENYERYFVPTIPAPLAQELFALADVRPGERVLDVACGTGIVARLAAEHVGPTGAVVGVDLAPDMLALARSVSATAKTPIDWREGNAESLPVDDGAFDVVLSQLGLMFVGDKPAAAREMRRVLASGGRVVINVPGTIQPLNEILGEALARHVEPALEGFVRAVFGLDDPQEVEQLLVDAGLRDVSTWSARTSLRLPAPADYLWQYVTATPLAGPVLGAADDARAALEREVVERWQPFVDGDGMRYDQPIVWATARR